MPSLGVRLWRLVRRCLKNHYDTTTVWCVVMKLSADCRREFDPWKKSEDTETNSLLISRKEPKAANGAGSWPRPMLT